MKVILTVEADELKLAQLLSKFAEKYRMSYKLRRQTNRFQLELELNSNDFGEFVRRLNHLKEATYKIEELRGGSLFDKFNVHPTRTNVDALIDKVMGELWLSRTEDETVVKEGSRVRVIRVEGVSLIVEGVN
jgi:hypothetical protein